ncbi:MAG TPA: hypothetical protein DCE23_09905 [Firmicutes bacterium]|nr:hypothetical protein [Bacillota bacterium]
MKEIKTVDLWTEQYENQYECFNGAFVDGFSLDNIPFDEYKIIRNCNCLIEVDNPDIKISNKHNAIVFYKNKEIVRLVVLNKKTDIDKCIEVALNQYYGKIILKDIFEKNNITFTDIDMHEEAIYKDIEPDKKEIDVGSCDRWNLLYSMLKGSYTESNTSYGNFESDRYEFIPELYIKYELLTNTEKFIIEHKCAFINTIKTRLIPIQENSLLTRNNRI